MRKLALFVLSLVLCCSIDVFSQAKKQKSGNDGYADIFGTVRSRISDISHGIRDEPMIGAVVQLFISDGNQLDSLYTTADTEGKFFFKNVVAGKVRVKATMLGYSGHDNYYDLESGTNVIMIMLESEDVLLKEAKVTAEMELMRTVKDTTIYNAAAVYTQNDESARSILEQLPGVKITGNNINVDGQRISKAYVNGILVFGDSPMTAVSSLKAEEVKEIKVYDELTAEDRHRGMMNGEREKVMNIVTKEPILSLTQAAATGAAGIDGIKSFRGHGAAAIMFNSEMTSVTAAFKAGNIDRDDLNQEYANANQLTSVHIDGSPYTENSLQHAVVLRGEKHFKNRDYGNSIKGYYLFDRHKTRTASHALTDYFETVFSPEMTYADTLSGLSANNHHVLYFSADLKDTPLKSFLITSSTEIVGNSENSAASQRIKTSGAADDIYSNAARGNSNRDIKSSLRIFWSNNDSQKYRPNVTLDFGYGNINGNGWTLDTLASSHTRRQLQSEKVGESYHAMLNASLNRTLTNTQKRTVTLQFNLFAEYDRHTNRQMSYDFLNVLDPVLDPGMSYDYKWNTFNCGFSSHMTYDTKSAHLSAGVDLVNINNLDRESYPIEYRYDRNYFNILPQILFNYKFNQYQSLESYISTSAFSPSLEQTRDRICDANPLSLSGGNKDLKQSYSFFFHNRYSLRLEKRNTFSLVFNCSMSTTLRQIVTKTNYFSTDTVLPEWENYIAKAGAMLHTFENVTKPSYSINLESTVTDMFVHRKLTVALTPSWTMAYSPQYVRDEMIGINSNTLGLSSRIVWKDKINRFSITPRVGWSKNTNDRGNINTEAITYSLNLTGSTSFIKGKIFIGGGYSLAGYKYLSSRGISNMNQNLFLRIGGFLFKNTVQVVLIGGDLLSAGSNYSIVENALSYSQTWTPSYGRYAVFCVSYRFRHKKS